MKSILKLILWLLLLSFTDSYAEYFGNNWFPQTVEELFLDMLSLGLAYVIYRW